MSSGERKSARSQSRPGKQTAGGDNALNLDEEFFTVLVKEYEEGEKGKREAIQDVKSVLHEVSKEPVVQAINKLIPHFLSSPSMKSTDSNSDESTQPIPRTTRVASKTATPRFAKLTARPSARGPKTCHPTEETMSSPNILIRDGVSDQDIIRLTTSAPTLPATTRYPSTASSSSDVPSSSISRKSRNVSRATTVSSIPSSAAPPTTRPPCNSILSSNAAVSDENEETEEFEDEEDEEEEDEEERVAYTENLLQLPADLDDAEEIWKSDIVELTKMKSAPRGKWYGPDVLELKYKEPEWPHQQLLNHILVRLPSLTHLILDGSELRFLRDLGSSLQSLITLSICDCGLRSLDGAYAMPNLRTLIARKNKIRIPTQCSFLSRLSYLDLSSNPISSIDEFGNLRHCGELRILKLHDTPLAAMPDFNKKMKRLVPQLREIHPPSFDMSELKQIRKQGQHQMREKNQQEEKKGATNDMPSLSYSDVMLDEPKPGIAYQKIPQSQLSKQKQQQSETEDVRLGIFMGPKFLKHLEKYMPPSTAELEREVEEKAAEARDRHHYPRQHVASIPPSKEEMNYTETEDAECATDIKNTFWKEKSDGDIQSPSNAAASKNHPMGDAV